MPLFYNAQTTHSCGLQQRHPRASRWMILRSGTSPRRPCTNWETQQQRSASRSPNLGTTTFVSCVPWTFSSRAEASRSPSSSRFPGRPRIRKKTRTSSPQNGHGWKRARKRPARLRQQHPGLSSNSREVNRTIQRHNAVTETKSTKRTQKGLTTTSGVSTCAGTESTYTVESTKGTDFSFPSFLISSSCFRRKGFLLI